MAYILEAVDPKLSGGEKKAQARKKFLKDTLRSARATASEYRSQERTSPDPGTRQRARARRVTYVRKALGHRAALQGESLLPEEGLLAEVLQHPELHEALLQRLKSLFKKQDSAGMKEMRRRKAVREREPAPPTPKAISTRRQHEYGVKRREGYHRTGSR